MFALSLTLASAPQADGCDAQAAKVATAVGALVRARNEMSIALDHPSVQGLRIDCDGPAPWKVAGGTHGPGSLQPATRVIAQTAGLALHTRRTAVASAIQACLSVASRQTGELSEATRAGLTVECIVNRDRVTMDLRQAAE